jgi:crotonobetainyl-CoA:carnitine CoA-transferase CaiB-like acyl-CoA transferase
LSGSRLPLQGVRVVDFTRLLPGPWCTQVLGDLGADVIKIEQPEVGDYGRFNPPHYKETGVYFAAVNRNKRSIALDMAKPDDRKVALDLVLDAGILIESFRPGVTARLGIDYASIRKINPSIVYCSVNGFGADGDLGRLPGHDLSIQGMSGLLEMRAAWDGPPPIPSFQTSDYSAAIYSTIGILAAHIRRIQTGEGCYLDVPMYDTAVAMASVTLSSALARLAGHSGKPELGSFGTNPRYACYETRDGKFVSVSLLEMRTWHVFCRFIGRPDLIYDEHWADRHSTHGERAGQFKQAILDFCKSDDRDPLVARCLEAGIPICPVYDADETVTSAEAKARDLIGFLQHPVDGAIPYVRDPLERAGLSDPSRHHAPSLGEHDAELRELARTSAQRTQQPAGR